MSRLDPNVPSIEYILALDGLSNAKAMPSATSKLSSLRKGGSEFHAPAEIAF